MYKKSNSEITIDLDEVRYKDFYCVTDNNGNFSKDDNNVYHSRITEIKRTPNMFDFIENQLKTHNTQELIYPKYFNEEFAEFLGIYHADGHYRDSKDGFYVTIANQSMDVYNRLVYLCKNLFNVEPKREINGDKEVNIRIKLTHLRCLQNVLVKGALNKRIPEQIRHSNKQVIKAYLKGMTLDSSRFKNKFLITVRNKIDGQFIQMFLCSQGILSALRAS